MNEMIAIVIGSGCDTDLAIIRSLGRRNVPVIIISSNKYNICRHSKYVRRSIILQNPDLWGHSLISLLLNTVPDWAGAVLIPASDYAVNVLAENKSKLSEYYKVAVPDINIIEKCINKKNTLEMAVVANVPIPETYFPEDISYIYMNKDKFTYPCILKPLISHKFCATLKVGKMFKINDFDDLISKFVISSNCGLGMMITQLIHGDCKQLYTYYAYRTIDGDFLGEVILKKLIQSPPDFGVIVAGESVQSPEILEIGRRFFNELSYDGLGAIEFKRDPIDGKFKILEINARAGLGTNLAIQSGVDFPWIIYNDKCRSNRIKIEQYVAGLKVIFIGSYILTFFRYRKLQKWGLRDYLDVLKGNRVYNNYDSKDIRPFIFGFLFVFIHILKLLYSKSAHKR